MATQSPSTPKSKGGRTSKKTPGVLYDKTAYYLPESLALLLQFVEMFLKRKGESVYASQTVLEASLSNKFVALCRSSGLVIPDMFMPIDNPALHAELVKAMAHYRDAAAKEAAAKAATAATK